jgi:hypothetical protein
LNDAVSARLARAGGAGEQQDPALLVGQPGDDLGQPELVDRLDDDRDRAHDDRDRPALAEGVDAEAAEALDRVREVDLVLGLELGDLLVVAQHLAERPLGVLGIQPLRVRDRLEVAVQADQGIRGHLEMQVGALGGDEVAQRVIEIKSHDEAYIGGPRASLE